MKTGLSHSTEERAINYIIAGLEPSEAVEKALQDENALILELLEQKTERSKKAKEQICKNVYALSHIFNCNKNNK